MSQEQAKAFEERGIAAAKAGQKDVARKLLQQSLRIDPNNDNAWLWLASVARDQRERLLCLQKVLEVNPTNEMGLKAVTALGIDPARLIQATPSQAEPETAEEMAEVFEEEPAFQHDSLFQSESLTPDIELELNEDDKPFTKGIPSEPLADPTAPRPRSAIDFTRVAPDLRSDGTGVPIATPDSLDQIQEVADRIIQAYRDDQAKPNVTWVHKTKHRAGEREILVLRTQVAIIISIVIAVVLGLGVFTVNNSPEVQLALFGASETPRPPTSTPTSTPTNTPGFTPTPSPTLDFTENPTFTPSPTVFPSITPGQIEITPIPTNPTLPVQPGQAVLISDELLQGGNAEDAVPLLATARAQAGTVFDPNPYYYEALAYIALKNYDAAANILLEAEDRLDRLDGVRGEDEPFYRTVIDLGFAQLALAQARDAAEINDQSLVNDRLEEARSRTESAVEVDNQFSTAYVTLAEIERLQGQYNDAVSLLSAAQVFPSLVTDENLVIAKGYTYLEEGFERLEAGDEEGARAAFENAAYEAFYARYINPYNPRSHELQIEAALALDDPGLAVIYSQGFLLFFPDNAVAFHRLGNARSAEGNTDLALDAYDKALERGGTDEVIADILISRAELYQQQQRYSLEQQDLARALELDESLTTRVKRMYAAYNAGDYETAEEDVDALFGTGVITDNEIDLMRSRLIADQAGPRDTDDYEAVLELLNAIGNDLPSKLIPVADEYRARAHLALGNLGDALNAIDRALATEQTGSRRFLRGQIFQAQDDRANAIAEYEWILTWDQVYGYPFADEARKNLDTILEIIARENAQVTATRSAEFTATAHTIATVTATVGVPRTQTAEAQTAAVQIQHATGTTGALTPVPTQGPTTGS